VLITEQAIDATLDAVCGRPVFGGFLFLSSPLLIGKTALAY
jgi:hypothetical protein